MVALPLQTVTRELALPPPAPGTPGPLSLADADALEVKVRQSGFEDVRTERGTVTAPWESASEFVRFMQAISAPINNALADQSPERREEVWRAIEEAIGQHAASDGSVRLENEVIYLTARR
jgi:hypothetical protein